MPSTFYPQALDTTVCLRFEGGEASFVSISRQGRNTGVAALVAPKGFILPAVPYGEGILGCHIPLGRLVELVVLRQEDGGATGLRALPAGQVAAKR